MPRAAGAKAAPARRLCGMEKNRRKRHSNGIPKLPKGTENISIIGLGNSSLGEAGEKEAQAAVELALENGVNFF